MLNIVWYQKCFSLKKIVLMRDFNECNFHKCMNLSHLIKHKNIFPGAKMLLNKDKSLTCLNLNLLNADI